MIAGERGPSKDELTQFVVELDWIFFKNNGVRKELIQFLMPDQITHTKFQVTGKVSRVNAKDRLRVMSIYSDHDLSFLNASNATRLRNILREKIAAQVDPLFVPALSLDIISFGEIRHNV